MWQKLIVLLEVFYSATYLDKSKVQSNENNWMSGIFFIFCNCIIIIIIIIIVIGLR